MSGRSVAGVAAQKLQQQQQQQQQLQWKNTAWRPRRLFLFVPGLGRMCSGRVPAGAWLVDDVQPALGYVVAGIVPGIVLHIPVRHQRRPPAAASSA